MNVWLELHVDDEVLTRDPGGWPEAAALLDGLAAAAESEGGRLSFRVRSRFALGDTFGFLQGLRARGHEIGAHAHVRDLEASVAALRAAGIEPTVMAPGLVQCGPRGEAALIGRAVKLGAQGLTDRLEVRRWTYAGWLPRRHALGPWMLDVSVSPFQWGVLKYVDGRMEPIPGTLDWAALHRCARVQATWIAPEGHTPFFGATFHEADVCPPRSLTPLDARFDDLRRWVAAWRPRPAAEAAVGPEVERRAEPGTPRSRTGLWGVIDRSVRWRSAPHATIAQARSTLLVAAGARFGSPTLPPHQVIRSPSAQVAVVAVHAGEGGLAERLRFLGLPDEAFSSFADLWLYARRPAGWPAPGNPAHVEDARSVIAAAAREGRPVVVLTWSGGCVAGARAILELCSHDPGLASRVAALVDVEGPPDRLALVKPGSEAEWASLSPHDDGAWVGRELVTLFPRLAQLPHRVAYHRWQGEPDHVHGGCTLHAEVAVARARAAGLSTTLTRVSGPLATFGATWRESMAKIVASVVAPAHPLR